MNDELWLVDTNILVYAFDRSEAKQEKAASLLKQCWQGKRKLAVSLQNLNELFFILTRKLPHPMSPGQAQDIVNLFIDFEGWIKLIPTPETLRQAMSIVSSAKVPFWDALIASAMAENNIHHIYTEDRDFSRMPYLEAKNPL